MNLEEVSGYSEARAAYDGAMVAAKAASDEVGEMRAEVTWLRQLDGFRTQLVEGERRASALEAARAEVKQKWGSAPEAVYAHLQDPDAIRQVAQAFHEQLTAAMAQQPTNGHTPPPPSTPWPTPPSGGQAPNPGHKWDDPQQWNNDLNDWMTTAGVSGKKDRDPRYKEMVDFVVERAFGASPNRR